MRLVFAGTPSFASHALEALAAAGHEIALVLTQPDRPAGRGQQLASSAVAKSAATLGLEIAKPATLRDPQTWSQIAAVKPDLMVVAAYGLLLPEPVLSIPANGCLNIHASLLPRWRGAAPIQRAILAGDAETGISIMAMEAGLDTGPVLLARRIPILPGETTGELTERLGLLGAEAIVKTLDRLDSHPPHPQATEGVVYAEKIRKSEALLDWRQSAAALERKVRAFSPSPGSEARLGGEPLKVWEASMATGAGEPGVLLSYRDGCPVVACGSGALALTVIQRPGSRRMPAPEFVKARPIPLGTSLGAEPAGGASKHP